MIEIKAPVLPESVKDATIVKWYKKVGEFVKRDDSLADLETDKVVLEVVAPEDGVVSEILKPEGSLVVSRELIGRVSAGVVKIDQPKQEPQPKRGRLGPAARRLAHEHESIQSEAPAETGQQKPRSRKVPMGRLRARLAERLVESKNTAAILTTFNEINMQAVVDARKQYKEAFEKIHGTRLGYMSFFVMAVVEALKQYPIINACIEADHIVYHDYYDIGVAIASERGLVVPVLREADQFSVAALEAKIAELGQKAQDATLGLEELSGGTFTISNGGVFGSLMSTPLINPPQSAILGLHRIEERPVVMAGEIVVRPMMYVALSYDHRLIDGADSVKFLVKIKEMIEDPLRLLIKV